MDRIPDGGAPVIGLRSPVKALVAALMLGGSLLYAASGAATAAPKKDFQLGQNSEAQACRAVLRFDVPPGVDAADIYCGAWETPSGRVMVFPDRTRALAALKLLCDGVGQAVRDPDFSDLNQIACSRQESGPRRFGLIASRGRSVAVGAAFPSDWPSLLAAAKVMSGTISAKAIGSAAAATAGQDQIQTAYPQGAPGQAASAKYELVRRRAYEHNAVWSFGSASDDFSELLRLHKAIAPEDRAGEGEILAEIALNLSNIRRFDEAAAIFDQASVNAGNDELLNAKILNYRIMDLLNRRQFDKALGFARATLKGESSDTRSAQTRLNGVRSEAQSMLAGLGEASRQDRAAILRAQRFYLAAVAARGLGKADAISDLDNALTVLNDIQQPPAWLEAQILAERAETRLNGGDYKGAESEARRGLALVATTAAGTRTEAHLWLTLEAAQVGLGARDQALASGRRGVAIFSRQTETPGMPGDIAARHLEVLLAAYNDRSDPALAAEYFETLALVWDGAAARSAAQLAARMALSDGGAQARAYQDAERLYRAALTTQQRAQSEGASANEQEAAVRATEAAAQRLRVAEDSLRQLAPRYLELVNPKGPSADVRGVLAAKEGYLRIVLGHQAGYAALITADGVTPYRIGMSAVEIEKRVTAIRRTTSLKRGRLPDFDLRSSAELYQALLSPVAKLIDGLETLQIDAGGSLASIPFAALTRTVPSPALLAKVKAEGDYSQVDWLGRHIAVATSLGPATFVRLRQSAAKRASSGSVAIYGDFRPDPGAVASRLAAERGLSESCRRDIERSLTFLDALPDTAREAQTVADIFKSAARVRLGADFTDSDFFSAPEVAQADVVLIATHGVLGLSSCFPEPALLTSLGPKGLGLIEASALLDLKLSARLVVLSACDTAGGGQLDAARSGMADGGEALSGLARGFIYAGASDVLATQWKVDSASSAAQMHAFFENAGAASQPLAKALASSQRSLYSNPETGHPFYWAAFVLIGDGASRIQ
ncbi:MAG: CHAT domain-containing protein [Caulobacter sp.]